MGGRDKIHVLKCIMSVAQHLSWEVRHGSHVLFICKTRSIEHMHRSADKGHDAN